MKDTDDFEEQAKKIQAERIKKSKQLVGLGSKGDGYDKHLYGNDGEYDTSIPLDNEDMEDEDNNVRKKLPSYTAPENLFIPKNGDDEEDVFKGYGAQKISDRENDYLKRRTNRELSPSRLEGTGYKEGMERSKREKKEREELEEKKKQQRDKFEEEKTKKRKSRWDQETKVEEPKVEIKSESKESSSRDRKDSKSDRDRDSKSDRDRDSKRSDRDRDSKNDRDRDSKSDRDRDSKRSDRDRDSKSDRDRDSKSDRDRDSKRDRDTKSDRDSKRSDRDEKPKIKKEEVVSEWEVDDEDKKPKRSRFESTEDKNTKKSRWDVTPVSQNIPSGSETPSTEKKRSRWDQTPVGVGGETPQVNSGNYTPKMTQEQMSMSRQSLEMDERNRYQSDEELDQLLPSEGYQILDPPQNYKPIRTPARKQITTPTPMSGSQFFVGEGMTVPTSDFDLQMPDGLPALKPEDREFFQKLTKQEDESTLTPEEIKERRIMELLLKIKNGTPQMRKLALRHITNNAREFGAGPLFNLILPLMMSTTLEDQERHLLVKVIDRILYKLDELVRPHVHKILVVIEPLLIDEDYYARIEGREIISNLAKAAGLATMIATMRPDIDHVDEYVRNTTARAFSVVAAALSIPSLLPFLRAVCKSTKSWQARHTGIKIVQQIAILMGCAILPHLTQLVNIIAHGLEDEQPKVRTITALAISALAEASAPYGIESFHPVIKGLYMGIQENRGKILAAYIKAIGYIIPLMEPEYASHYTREAMDVIIKEFASPDDEMKKIVLKVIKQCISTDGVQPKYVEQEILEPFFEHFWIARMALDRRNYKAVVETTVAVSESVGLSKVVKRIFYRLKDDSEPFRKMTMEVIQKSVEKLGTSDIDQELEKQLVDHILIALQEQTNEDPNNTILNGFAAVINGLGVRSKVYLPQICGTILWRLELKSPYVRQQSADLVSKIAPVIKICAEEKLLTHLSKVFFECLGEEYPEVLGSIIGALKAIFTVVGIENMNPPIKELLPRLTPILKNRHEKVQENTIDLVGRIADRGGDQVSIKEWMRICFELLEMLKAHKKGIRRAAVNTFGYIAKTIGPQDVLITLLNNLKVQERTNRVCTTVAIAIVAETCSPYTVLPALMNEYKVPELNVQNGVLKALSFLFEYIGEMGKDYIYAVTPLLEDALMDRDLVHRQTACTVVKHISLGVFGLNCEDALTHLLNFVWPNIFETSPHVINAVMEAIEGLRVGVGPSRILQYLMQGLFHPARFVRKVYWKVYNTLYISSQDEIVPTYPVVPDEKDRIYNRYDLDIMI